MGAVLVCLVVKGNSRFTVHLVLSVVLATYTRTVRLLADSTTMCVDQVLTMLSVLITAVISRGEGRIGLGGGSEHTSSIYLVNGSPVKKLVLNDNYGENQIKRLAPDIHPNQEVGPWHPETSPCDCLTQNHISIL